MMILDWTLMVVYKLHQPTTLQPINLHKDLFHFWEVVCAIFCHLSPNSPFICMFILVMLLSNRVKTYEKTNEKYQI